MAEEFHARICGGTWWNPSKTMFAGCSSPCSTGLAADMGSFGWAADMVDIKAAARSCEESNNSVSDSSIVFQDVGVGVGVSHHHHQKPQQQADSDSGGSSILIDSTLQMMGFGLSSSTTTSDWNASLLRGHGRNDQSSYNSIFQEDVNSARMSNCRQETGMDSSHQIQKDWSPKSYTTSPGEDSSITTFKPINQDFTLNSVTCSSGNNTPTSTSISTSTCQGLYGYPASSATLLQSLFEPDPPQHSLFNNRSINYMSATPTAANYGANIANELSSTPATWPTKLAPFPRHASVPKQQPSSLQFSNNTPFWNASAATAINDVKANFFTSPQSQFLVQTFDEKPNCPSLTTKTKNEEVRNSGSVMKKGSSEPPFKRPRIETPSPLPTFKVRKEKLGDRITALQQLVSPFGKTDTASVLHEAIEYIRFLHDQVNALSTPYMKQAAAASIQQQQQQQQTDNNKLKEAEGPKQDLRSRGLCLVPISSTFPVANETTADFWTPLFGGTFR